MSDKSLAGFLIVLSCLALGLLYFTACATTGVVPVSSGAVVETQRANDALRTQQQWQDMQRQQQEQIQRSNQQWGSHH